MLDKSKLSPKMVENTTLNPQEIEKFDILAKEWWDENGKMKSAIKFNQARIAYIQSEICKHFHMASDDITSWNQLNILEVGSGGGMLSESLAQFGATVKGIDASAVSVEVARRHAQQTATTNVSYEHTLSKDLVEQGKTFDVVINAEVIEHVLDQETLIDECCTLVKPGGLVIVATLNKTLKAYVVAILGAEYVLRYLPIGTHDWRYFVKPKTLYNWVESRGFELSGETGMSYNPFSGKWHYSTNKSVNYCLCFRKGN